MGLTRKAYTHHHHQNKPLQRTKKNIWKRINQSMMAMSESAVPTSAPIYLTIPQNVNQQSDRDRIEKVFPKKTMFDCFTKTISLLGNCIYGDEYHFFTFCHSFDCLF